MLERGEVAALITMIRGEMNEEGEIEVEGSEDYVENIHSAFDKLSLLMQEVYNGQKHSTLHRNTASVSG